MYNSMLPKAGYTREAGKVYKVEHHIEQDHSRHTVVRDTIHCAFLSI